MPEDLWREAGEPHGGVGGLLRLGAQLGALRVESDVLEGEPLVLQEEGDDGGLPQHVHHIQAQLVPVGVGGEVGHVPAEGGKVAPIK